MRVNFSNPGVYIDEIPSGARPIEVAGTSTAAFLGMARTGPQLTPTAVESFGEYAGVFGEISERGTGTGDAMALSVRAFFMNGGRRAQIVNVSSGGKQAQAELSIGREGGADSVKLFTAHAKGRGSYGNDLQVRLVPLDGEPTLFDCEVSLGAQRWRYKRVTLAPGLPESAEAVLRELGAEVELEPAPELAMHVFPSQIIDLSTNSSLELELHNIGQLSQDAITVDFTAIDALTNGALAEACQAQIASALSDQKYRGVEFICEATGSKEVRVLLKTSLLAATFKVGSGGSALSREKLFKDLLAKAVPHEAVLSADLTHLEPSQVSESVLGIRFGDDDLGRSIVLPVFGTAAPLETVAAKIQEAATVVCPWYEPALPVVSIQGGSLTVRRGTDAPTDIDFKPTATGWKAGTDSSSWSWTPDSEKDETVSISFGNVTLNAQHKKSNKAITYEFTPPQAGPTDLRVEAVNGRLLLWSGSESIAIYENSTGAKLLRLTASDRARTGPLNQLQPTLPIIAKLEHGEDGHAGGLDDYREALRKLEAVPDVSTLCLPGNPWEVGSRSIVEAAIRHADRMQDRMVIVDPPRSADAGDAWETRASVTSAGLPTSKNAAVYYPWLKTRVGVNDPRTGAAPPEVLVAPSGFAAGVWSRTDERRGVWKAPAGIEARLFGLSSLQYRLSDAESGDLNLEGVNTLRDLPGVGPVVWGARTLAVRTEPEWKYLSVRRLALMIEDSLKASMLWAVHEPNNSALWSTLRLNIAAFLGRLHAAGAFQPDSPADAFYVRCGLGTSMSQADIDAGIVRVRIGIAPVKPAEFVHITIEQISEFS